MNSISKLTSNVRCVISFECCNLNSSVLLLLETGEWRQYDTALWHCANVRTTSGFNVAVYSLIQELQMLQLIRQAITSSNL